MKGFFSLCLFQTVLLLFLQNISICHADDTSALNDLEKMYNEEHNIENNRAYGGNGLAQDEAHAHAEGETFGNSNGHSYGHAGAQPYSFGGLDDIIHPKFINYRANSEPDNIRLRKKLRTTTYYRKPFTTYGIIRANDADDSVNADGVENIDTVPSRISSINERISNVSAASNAGFSSSAGSSASASAGTSASASASSSASSCACDRSFVASDDVSFLCFSSKDGGKSFDIKYKGATKFSFEDINKAYKFYYDNMQANNFFVGNNLNGESNIGNNKLNVDANKLQINTFYEGSFFFDTDSQFNASTYENLNMNALNENKINLDVNENIDVNKNVNNNNEFNFDVTKYIDIIKSLNTNNNIDINKNLNYNNDFNFDAYKNVEIKKLLNDQNQFNFDVNKNIDLIKYLNLNHLLDITNVNNKNHNNNNEFNFDANNNIELNQLLNNQNQFNLDVNKNIDLIKYLNVNHLLNFNDNKNNNQNNLNDKNIYDEQFSKKINTNFNFNFDTNAKVQALKYLNSIIKNHINGKNDLNLNHYNFDAELHADAQSQAEAQFKAYIQAQMIAKAQAILEAQARAQAQAEAQAQAKTQAQIQSQTFGQPSNNAVIIDLGGGKLIKGGGGFNVALNGGFGPKFGKQINVGIEPHGLPSTTAVFGTSTINDGEYNFGPLIGGYIAQGDDINYADSMYQDNLDDNNYKDFSSGYPGVIAYPASIDNVPTPRYYNSGNNQTPEPRQAFTA